MIVTEKGKMNTVLYVVSMYYELPNDTFINTAIFQTKKEALNFMKEESKLLIEEFDSPSVEETKTSISIKTDNQKFFFNVSENLFEVSDKSKFFKIAVKG